MTRHLNSCYEADTLNHGSPGLALSKLGRLSMCHIIIVINLTGIEKLALISSFLIPDRSSVFIIPDLLYVSLAAKLALVVDGLAVIHHDALRVHL